MEFTINIPKVEGWNGGGATSEEVILTIVGRNERKHMSECKRCQ